MLPVFFAPLHELCPLSYLATTLAQALSNDWFKSSIRVHTSLLYSGGVYMLRVRGKFFHFFNASIKEARIFVCTSTRDYTLHNTSRKKIRSNGILIRYERF